MKPGGEYFKIFYLAVQNCRRLFVCLFGPKAENFITKKYYQFYIWKYEVLNKRAKTEVIRPTCRATALFAEKKHETIPERVTIVVPVFNAYEDLEACLNRVVNKTGHPHRFLIIDDGSTDPRIQNLLESYESIYPNISVIFNGRNLGYTATINKGCRLAGTDDVVLLNSDTQVTDNWLGKLYDCARSEQNVATVTPLSNAAGVFSVPEKNISNEIPDGISVDEMGKLVERLSRKLRPKVPTGSGFCMYVTRLALDVTGEFDEKNFPRGYGEENDFCMRAGKKGFIHLVDDSTYIYHKRSASFNKAKKKLVPASIQRLNRMHPEYDYLVMKWLAGDPLDPFRALLQDHLKKRLTRDQNREI